MLPVDSISDTTIVKKLRSYFARSRVVLPEYVCTLDSTRLIILFFSTSGSDLICDDIIQATELVDWIYSHQIISDDDSVHCEGFRGVLYTRIPRGALVYCPYDSNHITMVYAALSTLIVLGDDLSRVNRQKMLSGIMSLHCVEEPGCFNSDSFSTEHDMRFVFSATASAYILDGIERLNKSDILEFVGRCMTHDGGFAQLPGLESHAGATYCALSTLSLLDSLDTFLPPHSRIRDRIIKWLLSLQSEGFHGRFNKDDDTCYTFWICASLKLLHHEELINLDSLLSFVSRCWDPLVGGIRKLPNVTPDLLHTYLCVAGLSSLISLRCLSSDYQNLIHYSYTGSGSKSFSTHLPDVCAAFKSFMSNKTRAIDPQLNISKNASDRLKKLHQKWREEGSISREN